MPLPLLIAAISGGKKAYKHRKEIKAGVKVAAKGIKAIRKHKEGKK